jgi:uncharacterized repeat protein (TIGR01451 family)
VLSRTLRSLTAIATSVALLCAGALGAAIATTVSAAPAGATPVRPYFSGLTYVGQSADHPAQPPNNGSVNPDRGLSTGTAVTVSGNFAPGHTSGQILSVQPIALSECDHAASNCTSLGSANTNSSEVLTATGIVLSACTDTAGCTVKMVLTNDNDDTFVIPIFFAQSTTTTLAQTGGATLTVPFGTSVHVQATVTPAPGAFALAGNVQYSLFSDNACTNTVPGVGTTNPIPGDSGYDTPTTLAPGTYYWQAAYLDSDPNNLPSSSACGADSFTVTPVLVTKITGQPDSVTAGNDVQYTISVQNTGPSTVTGVHAVLDTLPAGVTALSSTPSGSCTLTSAPDCTIGDLASGASGSVELLVQSPSPAPASGNFTITARATPGTNDPASVVTTVTAPVSGTASGFVPPGGSLDTNGSNPTDLSLPNTGEGAPVQLTQTNGATFCAGSCTGPATFVSDFGGYNDPQHPIRLSLSFTDPTLATTLADYLKSTVYKVRDNQTVGTAVPDCADNPAWTKAQKFAAAVRRALRIGTESGIANPSPCVDQRSVTALTKNVNGPYLVTFVVLYLSDDGGYARRR